MGRGVYRFPSVQVRGKIGGMVFVPGAGGRLTVRAAPTRLPERTPAQRATAARFGPVGAAWNALGAEEAGLWRAYGEGPGARADGTPVQANNAFTALAAKRLQVRPGEPLPARPPTQAFLGDGVRIEIEPTPSGLRCRASGPNSEGVATELVAQRLRSVRCLPWAGRYRTQGFAEFEAGSLAREAPLEAGAWAAAVRFVRVDTGQETGVVALGVFEVG